MPTVYQNGPTKLLFFDLGESFESKFGQSFKIKGENNCNSEMIVYLVN